MGNRGPQKTPTVKLAMRGSNLAKTRKGEPKINPGYPPCPVWLKDEARDMWNKLVPELVNLGVMTKMDGFSFSRYCVYAVLWMEALSRPGRAETDFERYANQCLKLEAAFGLTPSSRASLNVSKPNDNKDKTTQYFAKIG